MNETTPKCNINELGPFDELEISWPGAEIESVMFDDRLLDGPAAGSKVPGATSFWRLPHNPCGELFVTARGPNGEPLEFLLARDPFADGEHTSYVRMAFCPMPSSGGINAWGVHVQPILELVSTADEKAGRSLPPEIYQLTLKVQRRDRPPIIRPLHVMDSFVTNVVGKLYDVAHKAALDWRQRMGSDEIPEHELHDALASVESGLSSLTEMGRKRLLTALAEVRQEGFRDLQTVRLAHGEYLANLAMRFWQDAAPMLVAGKLSPEELRSAGLSQPANPLRLATLILSDGDTLSIDDRPDGIMLDVTLPGGGLRPAHTAKARVVDSSLEWFTRGDEVAEKILARRVAEISGTWTARAAGLLHDQGIALDENFQDDATRMVTDAPAWLAAAAAPAKGAFSSFGDTGGLKAPDVWTRDGLPPEIVRRTLAYVIQLLISTSGDKASLARILDIEPGRTAHSTLLCIHDRLSKDPRYAMSVRNAAKAMHIDTRETNEGRQAALLLAMAGSGGEAEAFLDALDRGDDEEGLEIARTKLLPGMPRVVAT